MDQSRLFLVQIRQTANGSRHAVVGSDRAAGVLRCFDSAVALAQYLFAAAEAAVPPSAAPAGLSSRESEVALLFAGGSNHKRIALQLGLSPATVRNHLSACYRKLGVDNRSALLRALTTPLKQRAAMVHLHHGAVTAKATDWSEPGLNATTPQGEHP